MSYPTCRCGHVLVGTSLLLLLPALLTRDPTFRLAVLCLVATSVVFHATHARWAKSLDVCCVRLLLLWAVARARHAHLRAMALAAVVGIHLLPATHANGLLRIEWHAVLHAAGGVGLCAVA